jgi:uncharacterized protein (TIGR03083 family)
LIKVRGAGQTVAAVELVGEIAAISRRSDSGSVGLGAYRQLFDLLEDLTPADWDAATECEGWRVVDMVRHLVGAARANASLRQNLRQQWWGLVHRRSYGGNPLDATNARQIADHADSSGEQLVSTLRAIAPAAVAGRLRLPAPLRAVTVPIAPGGSTAPGMPRSVNLGHLVDVIYTRDVWMHTVDIARAVGQPFTPADPVNRRIVADVVAEWARRHGQPVDLVLSGAAGGHYRSLGTGRTVSGEPEAIERDAVEFCRIVSGRAPGDGLLATRVLF